MIELDNTSLKTKLESITKNVSNFNKGRETLSKIIDSSQSISSRKELGYVNKTTAPPKKEIRRNVNPTKIHTKNPFSKSIKIWVPKTNNNLIRKKYINTFLETVHKNKDYIFNWDTEPSWVWFPKI